MELLVVLLIAGAAVAAVLVPLIRGGPARDRALDDPAETADARRSRQDIEVEIRRYRAALREGTVCRRCGRANPPGSRFCAECGRRLHAGRKAADPKAA